MKSFLILFSVILYLTSTTASAEVYINGQLYQGASLYQLQQQYGDVIPSGKYWLMQNGNWGYMGNNQTQGNFFTDNQDRGYSHSSGQTSHGVIIEDSVSDFCLRHGCSEPYYSTGGSRDH